MDFNPIFGTDGDDSLQGTTFNDSIDGGLGNDTIDGGVGNDLLFAGAADDNSDDILIGGQGDDSLYGIGGRDTLIGGSGFDNYYGFSEQLEGATIVEEFNGPIGSQNAIAILAENTNFEVFDNLANNGSSLTDEEIRAALEDPSLWGDSFIALSRPQPGIIGIEKSGTDIIIDINRDGVAEAQNDLTIVNYFDEQGNFGGGVPFSINNLVLRERDIAELFTSNPDSIPETNFGTTVYRFFNNDTGVHFYTANETERDAVADLPNFNPEGASYQGADPLRGATPVYRFLNEDTGVHLYTVSETERAATENLSNFSFEGEAFSAYSTQVDGSIPIYRFFNSTTGAHFYTPNAAERDNVEDNLPEYQSEGIAYYALPSDF